jgi:RNA polymerase sigma factor (sigma-70 family)
MSDGVLLTEFASGEAGSSETAFAALVRRHVDMVYGTALRQLGDPGAAEEVTQNVFIVLARKSGALRGASTISGWLYKTALLEARHALRAELRRQRREALAVEFGSINAPSDSSWASLVPLLDEALMRLREGDRLAVLLRYFEDKPFREVGGVLGISEDAAQKRVAKSLNELTRFFQRRGLRVSLVSASASAFFAHATTMAPSALAATVTRSALASSGAAAAGWSGLGIVALKIMKLNQLPLCGACLLLVAMPVAFQAKALRTTQRETAALAAQLSAQEQSLQDAHEQHETLLRRLRTADNALATVTPQRATGRPPGLPPQWVDGSPFARVPAEVLRRAKVRALDRKWRIRPDLATALAMTPAEQSGTQQALDQFFAELSALEERHLVLPSPAPPLTATADPSPPQHEIFRISRYEPEANAARILLSGRLREVLGDTRAELALGFLQFRPAERPASRPDEPEVDGDFFDSPSHSSDRWNFQGYERVVTFSPPNEAQSEPSIQVDVRFGGNNAMGFGGGPELFNPAAAATLKARWEAYRRTHTHAAPAPRAPKSPPAP